MKNFFQIFFILLFLNSEAQNKVTIHVVKTNLPKLISVHSLISSIPKDCTVKSFIFSGNFGGSYGEYTCSSDTIRKEFSKAIHNFSKGQSFFIEQLKTDCPKAHTNSYKVVID